MNRQGHAQTLVATQPGNKNALKAGVFSERALAPRIQELDAAIADLPADEVVRDVLRREVAALAGLSEAMDRSLEDDGIRGRGGDPRSLINHRLRLNEKIRRTAAAYAEAVERVAGADSGASSRGSGVKEDAIPGPLPVTLAFLHSRSSITEIAAAELDPEIFLRAIIITPDPLVTTRDRLRARRILTRRRLARSSACVCFATLKARNELELRDWIEEHWGSGVRVSQLDVENAAIVRLLARGDRSMLRGRDWNRYWSTAEAFDEVLRLEVARARGEAVGATRERDTAQDDPEVQPFWRILLSADVTLAPHERLQAFAALDQTNVLPTCTCAPKKSLAADDLRAYTIRMVTQRHFRAAAVIARFPETYLAVRDAVDAAIVEDRIASDETAGASAEAEEPARAPIEHDRSASDEREIASGEAAPSSVALETTETTDHPRMANARKPHTRFTEAEMVVAVLIAWKDLHQPFTGPRYKSWRNAKPADERRELPTLAALEKTFGGWDEVVQFVASGEPVSTSATV